MHDLRLTLHRGQRGQLAQRHALAVGGADRQILQLLDLRARRRCQPHAHADHPRPLRQPRGDGAGHRHVHLLHHAVGGQPDQAGLHRIHLHFQRVAGGIDAVAHVDHAVELADRRRDLARGVVQLLWIVAIQLHLDRLRHRHQVADQVFHQLRQLDLQAGHLGLDLAAHLGHHLLGVGSRTALEADEEIALVGLGKAAAQLQPGAPRIGGHVGVGADDCLDLGEQSVGLGQRGARLGQVVENEAALVHLRHETGTDLSIGQRADQQQRHDAQQQPCRTLEQLAEGALVTMLQAQREAPRRMLDRMALVDQPLGQQRHRHPGQQVGDHQRAGHGQRQRLEERAGDPGEKRQRQEDHHGGRAGAGQRPGELPRGVGDALRYRPAAFAQPAHDVFQHHDHVVDNQPDRRRHPAQRHHVEAHVQHRQQQHGDRQHRGHHDQRHHDHPHVAQEHEQDQAGQHDADQDRVAHAAGGALDQLGLVVPVGHLHAGRHLVLVQPLLHVVLDLHAVAVGLLVDLQQHCVLAVGIHPHPLRHAAQPDRGHVAQPQHAARIGAQHDGTQRGGGGRLVVGQQQVQLVVILQPAQRLDGGGGGHRPVDVVDAQTLRAQLAQVHIDMKLARLAALHTDLGHPVDAGQQRAQLVFGQVVQLHRAERLRAQAVGEDRKHRRVHPPRLQPRAGRQLGQDLPGGGIHVQQRAAHVGAPVEGHRDFRAATAGGGAHIAHAAHAADRLLHRRGHLDRHLVGGSIAGIQRQLHARKRHAGKQRYRQPERAGQPAQHQHQCQKQQRTPVPVHPLGGRHRGHRHRACSRTAMPSESS